MTLRRLFFEIVFGGVLVGFLSRFFSKKAIKKQSVKRRNPFGFPPFIRFPENRPGAASAEAVF